MAHLPFGTLQYSLWQGCMPVLWPLRNKGRESMIRDLSGSLTWFFFSMSCCCKLTKVIS